MIFALRKIMHESLNLIIDLVLPEGVKKYFEVVKHERDIDNLHLFLDEVLRTILFVLNINIFLNQIYFFDV
jgi:hypothetical protein